MSQEFDEKEAISSMNFKWLTENGWTIPGNLAFRHILHDYNQNGLPSRERIEQIIMQHQAEEQANKIIEQLREFIELVNTIKGICNTQN